MKGDWDFWISDLVKNPDGTPVVIFSEVAKSILHIGAPVISSDLLRSVQNAKGSYRTYLSLVKLQAWFLCLQ